MINLPLEHYACQSSLPNFQTFYAWLNIQWWIDTLFELFMSVYSINNHGDKRRYLCRFLPHSHNSQWNFMQTVTAHGGLLLTVLPCALVCHLGTKWRTQNKCQLENLQTPWRKAFLESFWFNWSTSICG